MEETTSAWSARRKAVYVWSGILVLTFFTTFVFYKYWYVEPTCSDGFANGNETGIDCGGSCSKVCSAEAIAPITRSDPRIFQIYPTTYSLLAFVENRNIGSSAREVPYIFRVYDKNGLVIAERQGTTNLLKNKTIAVFEGTVEATSTPARVTFELAKNIVWTKDEMPAPDLLLTHSPLLTNETAPRIEATLQNNSLETISNIEVVAVVLDGKDNAIAASRTVVDRLQKDAKANMFFTWPRPFSLSETVCEKPSAVELLLDRSGSMASLGVNPPQPLTDVKTAAQSFVNLLKAGDKAGLVSFATDANNSHAELTENFSLVSGAIDALAISSSGTQYTNVADAVRVAREALAQETNPDLQKTIILLTDGIPTKPEPNPEAQAVLEASRARDIGISLFAIGLGKEINENFLRQLAATSSNVFLAPTAKDLTSIYERISLAICTEVPARIETYLNF